MHLQHVWHAVGRILIEANATLATALLRFTQLTGMHNRHLQELQETQVCNDCRNLREKEGLLQDMTQFGGRRVGPVGSTAVFQILTSDDPNLCL